jgi:hypothetical protein
MNARLFRAAVPLVATLVMHAAPSAAAEAARPREARKANVSSETRSLAAKTAIGAAAIAGVVLVVALRRLRDRAALEAAERTLEDDFRRMAEPRKDEE